MKCVLSSQYKVNFTTLSLTPRDMQRTPMIPSKRGQIKGEDEGENGAREAKTPYSRPCAGSWQFSQPIQKGDRNGPLAKGAFAYDLPFLELSP